MVKINILKPFRWSPNGNDIVDILAGEQEVPDRCADVAVQAGWGEPVRNKAVAPTHNKAKNKK